MGDDNTFRWTILILIAVTAPGAFYFRLRSATPEKLDRWQEGGLILFGLRLSGIPMAAAGLAWLIHPPWMAWALLPLPEWLRWFGIGVFACSGGLVFWTFYNLGRNLTDTVVTRENAFLVTTGPYRFVRHPFYTAFALMVSGASLAMANWFIPLAAILPMAFLVARTPIEEAKLIERFGDGYRDYKRRVGRFVPRFRS